MRSEALLVGFLLDLVHILISVMVHMCRLEVVLHLYEYIAIICNDLDSRSLFETESELSRM